MLLCYAMIKAQKSSHPNLFLTKMIQEHLGVLAAMCLYVDLNRGLAFRFGAEILEKYRVYIRKFIL